MKLKVLGVVSILFIGMSSPSEDEAVIQKIYHVALTKGMMSETLREIFKHCGHRTMASKVDMLAVRWSKDKLMETGFSSKASLIYLIDKRMLE